MLPHKYKPKIEAIVFDTSFFSRIFEITYQDQFVELLDACVFRICHNAYPNRDPTLNLKIALLYVPSLTVSESSDALAQMKEVSSYEVLIRNACDGLQ